MNQTIKIISKVWDCNGEYIEPWDLKRVVVFDRINSIEKFILNCCQKLKLEIEYGDNGARYYPIKDKIGLPLKTCFKNPKEYYRIVFHELTHSIGNQNRCNRIYYDDDPVEELVAEINAYRLMDYFNINTPFSKHNSIVYCRGWIYDLIKLHNDEWIDLIKVIIKDVEESYNYLLKAGGDIV